MDQRSESSAAAFGQHYVRDIVYAAHDGLITTFAIIAGVRGAGLGTLAVLALGLANLAADGLSMGIGNYMAIKSDRSVRKGDYFDEWSESVHAARHGLVTLASFVLAGLLPLLPCMLIQPATAAFWPAAALTAAGLFIVGAGRSLIAGKRFWLGGLEMFAVGGVAALAAFATGSIVQAVVNGV